MNYKHNNQENILYITDLDGTLLNAKGIISDYTKKGLIKLIGQGIHFSVATARTPATVVDLLAGVPLQVPIVVMNGTAVYDIAQNKYLAVQYIDGLVAKQVQAVIKSHHQNTFIYTIKEHQLIAYYETITTPAEQDFYNERKDRALKKFVQGEFPKDTPIAYFMMLGEKNKIKQIAQELKNIAGISFVYYPDVYDIETYYLEVYHESVSKATGIQKLRNNMDFDKVISFGDNLNDQPMFKYCDAAYAVGNAKEALKEMATAIIATNEEDGVIKFLEEAIK